MRCPERMPDFRPMLPFYLGIGEGGAQLAQRNKRAPADNSPAAAARFLTLQKGTELPRLTSSGVCSERLLKVMPRIADLKVRHFGFHEKGSCARVARRRPIMPAEFRP